MAISKEELINTHQELLSLESNFKTINETVTKIVDMITQIWWIIVS